MTTEFFGRAIQTPTGIVALLGVPASSYSWRIVGRTEEGHIGPHPVKIHWVRAEKLPYAEGVAFYGFIHEGKVRVVLGEGEEQPLGVAEGPAAIKLGTRELAGEVCHFHG